MLRTSRPIYSYYLYDTLRRRVSQAAIDLLRRGIWTYACLGSWSDQTCHYAYRRLQVKWNSLRRRLLVRGPARHGSNRACGRPGDLPLTLEDSGASKRCVQSVGRVPVPPRPDPTHARHPSGDTRRQTPLLSYKYKVRKFGSSVRPQSLQLATLVRRTAGMLS